MKLTIVGCTGSMSGPESAASSYLIQADDGSRTWSLLLDLGPGAFGSLMRLMDPGDLDAIAISHLHADHMSDMISCHVYRRWHPDGALGPVPVYAPAGAVDRVRGVGGDSLDECYQTDFEFRHLSQGAVFEVGPMRVTAHAVLHPVEAYALRIEGPSANGGTAVITYSGDTDSCEGLARAAGGADLLLSEAAFVEGRDEIRGIHMTGKRAGKIASKAGVGQLVLTHIQPWTDPELPLARARAHFDGPVALAAAVATFEV
ncbi:MAG: MBL fold metallo-hydrolase [Ruaniaceae bacterium]|nr:MBL fold metallo-hydrolase [Ruaniaceae bacterium]